MCVTVSVCHSVYVFVYVTQPLGFVSHEDGKVRGGGGGGGGIDCTPSYLGSEQKSATPQ